MAENLRGRRSTTARTARARLLAPSFVLVTTALACGGSTLNHIGDKESGAGGTNASAGAPSCCSNPPPPNVDGRSGSSSVAMTTGGVGGVNYIGGAGGVGGSGGYIGGSSGSGGVGSNPPAICPGSSPAIGDSCSGYESLIGLTCHYTTSSCDTLVTVCTGMSWKVSCQDQSGSAGAGGDDTGGLAGAGGAP